MYNTTIIIRQLIPLVFYVLLWEFCSFAIGKDKFPHVFQIFSAIVESFSGDPIIAAQGGGGSGYSIHIIATFKNFVLGFIIGASSGFIIGIVMFQFYFFLKLFEPVIEMIRVVPPLIMIPFVLLIFGVAEISQILIICIYSAYSICIYTLNSLRNIEHNYNSLAEIYGSNKIQKIIKVQIPAIMPELVGAVRVTSAITWGIIVVGEYMGSPTGIGRILKFSISYTRIDLILVGIFWVVLMSLLVDTLIVSIFHFGLKWTDRHAQQDLSEICGSG
ncbi:ABC-type nitrate/sulfonate/bicarbonate transport system, permease component [Candidatus Methanophagaceae archaeon]|nr:ABC-type nitrate/sulfonate/bicarbonate transport system, permease component [Methanophagales archaeon]